MLIRLKKKREKKKKEVRITNTSDLKFLEITKIGESIIQEINYKEKIYILRLTKLGLFQIYTNSKKIFECVAKNSNLSQECIEKIFIYFIQNYEKELKK